MSSALRGARVPSAPSTLRLSRKRGAGGAFGCSGLSTARGLRPLSRGTPPQPLVVKGNLALDQIDLGEDLPPSYQTRAARRTDATPRAGRNYLLAQVGSLLVPRRPALPDLDSGGTVIPHCHSQGFPMQRRAGLGAMATPLSLTADLDVARPRPDGARLLLLPGGPRLTAVRLVGPGPVVAV